MAATVYQRPLSQGRLALQALYQFLLHGTCPPARVHVVPHLVMRSNLELFLERLPVELESAGATLEPNQFAPRQPAGMSPPKPALTRRRRAIDSRQRT